MSASPRTTRVIVTHPTRYSPSYTPWTILESNCKLYARVKALRAVAEAMEKKLGARS
jgi:polyphosphate kinase 2 (PPK2 family)